MLRYYYYYCYYSSRCETISPRDIYTVFLCLYCDARRARTSSSFFFFLLLMQPFSCSCLHRKATVDVIFFFMPEMKSHSSSPAVPAATGTAGRRQERKTSDRNRKKERKKKEKNQKIEKILVDSSSFFVDSFSRLVWPTIHTEPFPSSFYQN